MAIKQRTKSLKARGEELADTFFQLKVLNRHELNETPITAFGKKIAEAGFDGGNLQPRPIAVLQLNITKKCNQSCAHCHVDAGPDRTEQMSRGNLERCLAILAENKIKTVDITGGAPEMHPDFRWFVQACYELGVQVMNRCNLTILVSNPKYADLPSFFAKNKVHIVSSLPFYTKLRTDAQRGDGVFEDSIRALQLLNEAGYGRENTGLTLDLVYNPTGAFLPSGQGVLEPQFKKTLKQQHDIDFNQLFCITNMPISRYLDYLLQSGNYSDYMQRLVEAFNPATLEGVMCRNTISVSYDGFLYDCDFNQMLDLKVASPVQHISAFDVSKLASRNIVLNQHCYGCTAGAGSSCGGEIV